jgi:hypothetical protein
MDVNATERGETVQELFVENDAAVITLHVVSIAGGTLFNVKVESVGDHEEDVLSIGAFPEMRSGTGSQTLTVPVHGKLRVTAEYTGGVVFQMRAKGIGAAALTDTRPVKIEESMYQHEVDTDVLSELRCIRQGIDRLVNHLREITGIEADKGEDY